MKDYRESIKEEVSQVNDLDMSGTYSYADYLRWTFDDRVELIKGKIFKMSPAPARMHQKISLRIAARLYNHLEGKKCEVYPAPFDVRLPRKRKSPDNEISTVMQPDICVVCDPEKLDDKGCIGAPDIVVEILSPGNNKKELLNKYEVYEESGVKEYWVVWPDKKAFRQYVLDNHGKFQSFGAMDHQDEVTTPILPGFVLKLDEVFQS